MIKNNTKYKPDDKPIDKSFNDKHDKKRTYLNIAKDRKNTRRRLSISTKSELPNDTDEIKRSIKELKQNESKFKEGSKSSIGLSDKKETQDEEEAKIDVKKSKIKKRSSIAGVQASHFQEDFEKKCVKIKGSVDKLHENGIGYVCRKGLKPESPNQDDFIIITMENLALYAIFDGHGPYGHDVSNYVQKELPYMIIRDENFLKNPKKVFTNAFLSIHENIEKGTNLYLESIVNGGIKSSSNIDKNKINEAVSTHLDSHTKNILSESDNDNSSYLESYDNFKSNDNIYSDNFDDNINSDKDDDLFGDNNEQNSESDDSNEYINEKNKLNKKKNNNKPFFDGTMSGTTATIIVHLFKEKKLYVAYVGDSRAVLGKKKKGSSKKIDAIELTKDHKPNSEGEKKRIIKSGGQVLKLEGDIPYRVFLKNKFYPGLAMSRAIGDTLGHQIGIISEPDFMEVNINEDEDILVLICSDGVWEFISSEEAVNMIYEYGYDKVQDAAENLAKESWDRWLSEEENIVDDITVQAIYLSDKLKNKN
ncbi:hypothetical protein YYE_01055 [Plasmodium vinckei vinckei]|nr:hypothetical protein YYE_01055 [Plasmodium vinckei vinckei]